MKNIYRGIYICTRIECGTFESAKCNLLILNFEVFIKFAIEWLDLKDTPSMIFKIFYDFEFILIKNAYYYKKAFNINLKC